MSKFTKTPEGWYRAPVPEHVLEKSKAKQAAIDERIGVAERAAAGRRFATQHHWTGHVGERALRALLLEFELEHEHNGGYDDKPDIVLAGKGVAVKTSRRGASFRRDFWLALPTTYLRGKEPELFWAGFEDHRTEPHLVLLGGITRNRFKDEAQLVYKGTLLESGEEAKGDFWRIRVSALERPLEWLCRLTYTADLQAAQAA